jgi:predicted SAM-dependent methyltransferase
VKLNLGCGINLRPGFVNVDKFGNPDVRLDLEEFPWPWPDNSAEVIELHHVLEHLGQTPAAYIRVLQELYRVAQPNGLINITVPHFRHDHFANDPTHVRVVTPEGLRLFNQDLNHICEVNRWTNSQLGRYHGVDFEMLQDEARISEEGERFRSVVRNVELTHFVNVFKEFYIVLKAIKPPRFPL